MMVEGPGDRCGPGPGLGSRGSDPPTTDPGWPDIVRVDRAVLDGGPALQVVHDVGGRWDVVGAHRASLRVGGRSGDVHEAAGAMSWTQLIAADPSLQETSSLPPGWLVRRDTASAPWRRTPR